MIDVKMMMSMTNTSWIISIVIIIAIIIESYGGTAIVLMQ